MKYILVIVIGFCFSPTTQAQQLLQVSCYTEGAQVFNDLLLVTKAQPSGLIGPLAQIHGVKPHTVQITGDTVYNVNQPNNFGKSHFQSLVGRAMTAAESRCYQIYVKDFRKGLNTDLGCVAFEVNQVEKASYKVENPCNVIIGI